ncbi:MAG: porin family protein [Alphaproteobacteria bacterium]|nr:porin family protein [Alphaproteobacteria bacterium]
MKKLLLLSAIAMVATSASALEVKPYVEGKVTHNWLKAEYKETGFTKENMRDNVFGGALEVGAKINQFRVGLEGYYNDKMEDKLLNVVPVKGETKGFFLNGYWDIPADIKVPLKPYIGAGIGYSWLKETADLRDWGLGKESIKDKDWGWNVGFGVGYVVNENIDLTLGYRYEDLGKIKDYDSKTKFTNHKVSLGLRYTF